VTVGEETYRLYRYEGALSDIFDTVVLFCWKAGQPMTSKHLRCFLSTNTELSDQIILEYYTKRWSIENYFRQTEETLGFDHIESGNERAIK
jgi:IS4 transposase